VLISAERSGKTMVFEKGKVRCFLVSFFGFATKMELKDGRAKPF